MRRHRTGLVTLAVAYAVTMCTLWPRTVRAEESAGPRPQALSARHNAATCRRLASWKHSDDGPGVALVQAAQHFLGCPYRWGGASSEGFDCSGLVWYVHQLLRLPIPRRAEEQSLYAGAVNEAQLQPGDLLFFHFVDAHPRGSYIDAHYTDINHVGIYAGNGRFIHAPKDGKPVTTSRLQDFKPYLVKAGRYWSGAGMLARE